MVVVEVADKQQVTIRSKGKMAEWEAQEAIGKQATEWIEKANERNRNGRAKEGIGGI